jgi:hypothetical protein
MQFGHATPAIGSFYATGGQFKPRNELQNRKKGIALVFGDSDTVTIGLLDHNVKLDDEVSRDHFTELVARNEQVDRKDDQLIQFHADTFSYW